VKFLTAEENRRWCEAQGVNVSPRSFLYHGAGSSYSFTVGLEDKPSSVIALADYLVPTWEDTPFDGALFWFRERGIWGDFSETTGDTILQQMRLGQGEAMGLWQWCTERKKHIRNYTKGSIAGTRGKTPTSITGMSEH
jgi:hypothetical protein